MIDSNDLINSSYNDKSIGRTQILFFIKTIIDRFYLRPNSFKNEMVKKI